MRRCTRSRLVAATPACCLAWLAIAAEAHGQIRRDAASPDGAACRLGPATVFRYQVGATVAARGPTQNIRLMVAVPWECPEQQVRVVEEDVAADAQISQRKLDAGEANQLLVLIPQLGGGQKSRALLTFEVTTHVLLPPEETGGLRVPADPPRPLKQYLGKSPYIDTDHREIRQALDEAWKRAAEPAGPKAAEEPPESALSTEKIAPSATDDAATADAESQADPPGADDAADAAKDAASGSADATSTEATSPETFDPLDAWERVEAIYDYVLEHVAYLEGEDQSSVQVLRKGQGDCQAIGALFVAMCRTAKVPARLVWVHGHQYAEFYLEDAAGAGHWYPVETAGQRAFGEMPVARVILQKGDNFRVPERRRERLRYASDYALFLSTAGTKPSIKYVRNLQ